MISFLKSFHASEEGAVTVDWVVLTALVVGLVAAAYASIQGGTNSLALDIQAYLLTLVP